MPRKVFMNWLRSGTIFQDASPSWPGHGKNGKRLVYCHNLGCLQLCIHRLCISKASMGYCHRFSPLARTVAQCCYWASGALHGAKTKRTFWFLFFWGKYCRLSCALCTVGSVLPGSLVRYSSLREDDDMPCQATEAQLVAEKDLQVGIRNQFSNPKMTEAKMTELLL